MISSKLESSLIFYLETDPLRLWYYPRQWLSTIPNIGDEDLRTLLWSYIFLQQHDFTTAVSTLIVSILKVFLQRAANTYVWRIFEWKMMSAGGGGEEGDSQPDRRTEVSKLLHSYLQIQRSFMTWYLELLKNKLFTFYLNCWHGPICCQWPLFHLYSVLSVVLYLVAYIF